MAENINPDEMWEKLPVLVMRKTKEGDWYILLSNHKHKGLCMTVKYHFSPFGEMDLTWMNDSLSYPTTKENKTWISKHPFTKSEFWKFGEGSREYSAFELLLEIAEQEKILSN